MRLGSACARRQNLKEGCGSYLGRPEINFVLTPEGPKPRKVPIEPVACVTCFTYLWRKSLDSSCPRNPLCRRVLRAGL
jgi:hypothetical protein